MQVHPLKDCFFLLFVRGSWAGFIWIGQLKYLGFHWILVLFSYTCGGFLFSVLKELEHLQVATTGVSTGCSAVWLPISNNVAVSDKLWAYSDTVFLSLFFFLGKYSKI